MSSEAEIEPVAERAFINTPQQVEALSGKMRMRILKAAAEPRSVRELAVTLGVPATRLYYHVNMLEEAGFLRVVETRKSGARIEKIYRVAAKSFGAGPDLAHNVENVEDAAAALTGLVLDVTRVEAETAISRNLAGESKVEADIARASGNLTADQVKDIKTRMEAILIEFATAEDAAADTRSYSFTYLFLPTEMDDN